jgi:hypothetical protein
MNLHWSAATSDAIETSSGKKVQINVQEKRLIAEGPWASVYRAKLLPTRQIIAIKEIRETKEYKVVNSSEIN